ncbi:kinase-like domain-containing protein [Microdochium bolleyi]|uniref:non-specific serine/threonine protein kinase n=1 Tax=Microdochium bolleyi TaxID=196109 RepID=A0A136JJZ8_9PEZI|nr:kinase-like domain-containing protein [Microdochium bolleyi]
MASELVIARLDCVQNDDRLPGFQPAGDGLSHNNTPGEPDTDQFWQRRLHFSVHAKEIINVVIDNCYVSRQHFEIYSVIYDNTESSGRGELPMVYVRDCQSLEGTFVNGCCIGSKAQGHTPGYLLSHGDVITIAPYWEFHVELWSSPSRLHTFSELQIQEMHRFRDRYVITDRRLGKGSVGSVYLAFDVRGNRQVACKIHNLDELRESRYQKHMIRRVIDESDILGKIRHPNILHFEYAFRSRHTLYTFIELATGGDLFSTVLFYNESVPPQLAQLIIYQIVRAVRHLHRHHLTHRDLKPENIFFADGPSGKGRAIVGDLGFATSIH